MCRIRSICVRVLSVVILAVIFDVSGCTGLKKEPEKGPKNLRTEGEDTSQQPESKKTPSGEITARIIEKPASLTIESRTSPASLPQRLLISQLMVTPITAGWKL